MSKPGKRKYEHRPSIALERELQEAILEYLEWCLPDEATVLGFAGGDGRPTRTKAYVPGTPDLVIIYKGSALFMELKRSKFGNIASVQQDMAETLLHCGAHHAFIRTADEAYQFLSGCGVPLKGRLT